MSVEESGEFATLTNMPDTAQPSTAAQQPVTAAPAIDEGVELGIPQNIE